jgi:hypothetical protein
MTISQRMTQGRAVWRHLVLSTVVVLAFAAGSIFGVVAHDVLLFSSSQAQLAPHTMAAGAADSAIAAEPAGTKASSPWELYHCSGCPDAAGIVRYFTGTESRQGPWELYHCEGCPDADGKLHSDSVAEITK